MVMTTGALSVFRRGRGTGIWIGVPPFGSGAMKYQLGSRTETVHSVSSEHVQTPDSCGEGWKSATLVFCVSISLKV